MLSKMYNALNVNNLESAITKAEVIQRDVFCFGMATQYTEKEIIASEFILDYVIFLEDEQKIDENIFT